jgi:hypothetical protein
MLAYTNSSSEDTSSTQSISVPAAGLAPDQVRQVHIQITWAQSYNCVCVHYVVTMPDRQRSGIKQSSFRSVHGLVYQFYPAPAFHLFPMNCLSLPATIPEPHCLWSCDVNQFILPSNPAYNYNLMQSSGYLTTSCQQSVSQLWKCLSDFRFLFGLSMRAHLIY